MSIGSTAESQQTTIFDAPSKSFQELLDKIAEEHCREVHELRKEVEELRSVPTDSVKDAEKVEDLWDCPIPQEFEAVNEHNESDDVNEHNDCDKDRGFHSMVSSGGTMRFSASVGFDSCNPRSRDGVDDLGVTAMASWKHSVCSGISNEGCASVSSVDFNFLKLDTAQVHDIWLSKDTLMSQWSVRFDKISRLDSMQPRISGVSMAAEDYSIHPCRYFCLRLFLPLLPTSKLKVSWDLTALLALLYDITFIPMQTFDIPDDDTSFIGMFDWIFIVFWTLDLPLNFLVGYYKRDGGVVMDLRKIACHYSKRWLVIDLAIIGNDWFTVTMRLAGQGDATGGGAGLARLGKIMRVARSMRTLRLLRLMKLREFLSYLNEFIESEWMSLMMETLGNLFFLVYVNHSIACLWFWLGSSRSLQTTWVKENNLVHAPWVDQYIASMHWSLTQFTAASSPIVATNPDERAFSVIVILFAIVAFSSFLSGITSAMTRLRTINAYNLTQSILLRKFLKQNKISRQLTARVTRYVQLVQHQQEIYLDAHRVEYLSLLTGPLDVELHWERYVPVLKPFYFFRRCCELGQSAMHHICFRAVDTSFLARQDLLFDWGAACEKMYFPQSGCLFYRRPPGFKHTPRYIFLGKDEWFCENALWTPWIHHGIMKALLEVTISIVNINTFHSIARVHPEVIATGSRFAFEFIDVMNNPDKSRPYTWDVPWSLMYPENGRSLEEKGKCMLNAEISEAIEREAALVDLEYSRLEEEQTT